MNKKIITLLLISLNALTSLTAQNLAIFDLGLYKNESVGFISLSDVYYPSEHPDSLAIPNLDELWHESIIEEKEQFIKSSEYFILSSKYRKRFLSKTNISETDKVFIYSYSKKKLISFPVSSLNVVACLNIYGADWPYSQFDFMIGFEINKRFLEDFEQYFVNTLVYVGTKSPFILNQLKPVVWQKIDIKDFPLKEISSIDTSYVDKYVTGNLYKFETEGLQYFIQDLVRLKDNWVSKKRLVVIELKTKKTVYETIYHTGESSSFAPLDNQWTGKLFKNRPPVILGFHWVSFGCPSITFLSPTEKDIYINCDNRH